MGCVSSNLFNHDGADDFPQIGSSGLSHHIVSLTSSTYGLLTLDPPSPSPSPMTPPPRFTFGSIFPTSLSDSKSLWSDPKPLRSDPEVINSWELMAGLEPKPIPFRLTRIDNNNKENSNPNRVLDRFEPLCPPGGQGKAILYTTSLRGVRKTFEACNAVRSAVDNHSVVVCERDVSMDRGFREELKELMKKGKGEVVAVALPRLFVKGRDVGGFEEVMRIVEEGLLGKILEGLPRRKAGEVCGGCGEARFLPCFECNGSAKMVVGGGEVVVKCPECNENGLVLCPICS